jgi:hypothetical protein
MVGATSGRFLSAEHPDASTTEQLRGEYVTNLITSHTVYTNTAREKFNLVVAGSIASSVDRK